MKNLTRRKFFGIVGSVLAGATVLVLPNVEEKTKAKPKIEKIERVWAGEMMTAVHMNNMVDAINLLLDERS